MPHTHAHTDSCLTPCLYTHMPHRAATGAYMGCGGLRSRCQSPHRHGFQACMSLSPTTKLATICVAPRVAANPLTGPPQETEVSVCGRPSPKYTTGKRWNDREDEVPCTYPDKPGTKAHLFVPGLCFPEQCALGCCCLAPLRVEIPKPLQNPEPPPEPRNPQTLSKGTSLCQPRDPASHLHGASGIF